MLNIPVFIRNIDNFVSKFYYWKLMRRNTNTLISGIVNNEQFFSSLNSGKNRAFSSEASGSGDHAINLDNAVIEDYMTKLSKNTSISEKSRDSLNLKHTLSLWHERQKLKEDLKALETLSSDPSNKDLQSLAEDEKQELQDHLHSLDEQLMVYLLPEKSQDHDPNSLILEVTAGVGGQEAMLFAAELLDMYQGYIAYRGWQHDRAEIDLSELGGLRHGTLSVNGTDCFTDLRQEGGVHRVQRVPKTEKSGRLHTSTVTVAILPQPLEVAITINPKDLKIETKRSSGAGGQHVNTTDSCVRLTYLPTGMVVECQTERSQVQNKVKAMQWLRARLFQQKLDAQQADIRGNRKQQMGSSFRSEKIRTYNFPQDRVTDHRVGVTLHNLKGFMTGGEPLYDLHTQLKALENREQFKLFLNSLAKGS